MKGFGNITATVIAAVICVSMIGCERESSNGNVDTVTQVTPSEPSGGVAATGNVSRGTPGGNDRSSPTPAGTLVGPTPTPEPNGIAHPCGPFYPPNLMTKPEHFIDWTPDGSRLIFDDGTAVMVVDADGSRLRAIVDANPRFSFRHGFHADVSPDGSRIAYSSCQYSTDGLTFGGRPVSGRGNYHYEIASVAIDGSDPKRLTANDYIDHYPTWSPDGSRIAFIRGNHYSYNFGPLRIMLEDGSSEQDISIDRTRPYGHPVPPRGFPCSPRMVSR